MSDDVPRDSLGNPMAKVVVCVSEKIGLPNYSNVDIGPISMTRWVEDTPESRRAAYEEGMREVEKVVAVERGHVLTSLGHNLQEARKP